MSYSKALAVDMERTLNCKKAAAVAKSDLIPPDSQWRAPPAKKKAKASAPMVRWKQRDSNGNVVPARPISARNRSSQAGPSRKADPGGSRLKAVPPSVPATNCEVAFTPDPAIAKKAKAPWRTRSGRIVKLVNKDIDGKTLKEMLKEVDDLPPPAKKAKASRPMVKLVYKDSDGNIIYEEPRSCRKRSNQAGPSRKADPGGSRLKAVPPSVPATNCEVAFTPDPAIDCFVQELQLSMNIASGEVQEEPTPSAPLLASSDWSTRKRPFAMRWRAERPRLVDSAAAKENAAPHICQQCAVNPAAVRCHNCLPRPFLCAECDIIMHSKYVLHNRDAMTAGFYQPMPPTTCIVDKAHCPCERLLPVEMPDIICSCPKDALKVKPGKSVVLVTMDGRYGLTMPGLSCEACKATWTAGVDDLIKRNYWPTSATLTTVYATDVFFSFEQMKMAAPGLSCHAFAKMLDQRTVHFGRTGVIQRIGFQKSFFEWKAVQYELEKLCKEEPFMCPACTPDMVAISVDGNRKHYRFKGTARSEEQASFDGIFIAKDEDVTRFVDDIHQKTKHASGRGVCGRHRSAARETSKKSDGHIDEEGLELAVCRHGVLLCALNMYAGEMYAYAMYLQKKLASSQISFFCMDMTCKYWRYLQKVANKCPELKHLLNMKPFLSVFHAKAHDFKCEVKWSGQYQDGAGLTLGEEVQQCNAFLSRIALTTKHMSKAGRTDMLSLMAMNWNRQKRDNLATTLARRYQKATKDLQSQLQNLESMKVQFAVAESQLEEWVQDVKEWAEAPTAYGPDALENKIEMLVVSLKSSMAGNKGCARIRRKIRGEKEILSSVVEQYNRMVPSTEPLCMDSILSVEKEWPWQLQHSETVDLRTKRKAFDIVMAVRRLKEEKKILVTEMKHHWKCLSTCADGLTELPRIVSSEPMKDSPWGLSEEGLNGLQSIIQKKLCNLREVMKNTRECYLQVLSGAENINILDDDDDEYDIDSEMSDDEL